MTIHDSTREYANRPLGGQPKGDCSSTAALQGIAETVFAPLAFMWHNAERIYNELRSRKALEDMLALDDTLLRDMGVTRGDVQRAIHLPVSKNAGANLADASRRSRFQ